MRKAGYIMMALAMIVISACTQKYDESAFNEKVEELNGRLAALETKVNMLNVNLKSARTVIAAAEAGNLITACRPLAEGNGYVIEFIGLDPITIYDGKDAANGADITDDPVIGIEKDITGEYCWTVDGEFMTDTEGNHIYLTVNVSQGRDGFVPQLRIVDGENDRMKWEISYDGGVVWQALGKEVDPSVATLSKSIYLFESVEQTSILVTFKMTDGRQFTISKVGAPKLTLTGWEGVAVVPNRTFDVKYSVENVTDKTVVRTVSNNGYKAQVKPADNLASGVITISSPASFERGDVLVYADNGYGRICMRKISFVDGTILVSDLEEIESMEDFIW